MQAISPNSSSENTLGKSLAQQEVEEETDETKKLSNVTAFKYKPRANLSSKSFRGCESPAKKVNEGEKESGYSSDRQRQLSLSEESSASNSKEGSKTELNGVIGGERLKNGDLTKPSVTKSHPYSKRIEISPRSPPTGVQQSRPKILYGKDDKNKHGSPAALARRRTLASVPTTRRLLPAIPVRRGGGGAQPKVGNEFPPKENSLASNTIRDSVNTFAEELVDSLENIDKNPSPTESDIPTGPQLHTTPSGSTSSINEQTPNQKVKHTVQYKKTTPLSNKG